MVSRVALLALAFTIERVSASTGKSVKTFSSVRNVSYVRSENVNSTFRNVALHFENVPYLSKTCLVANFAHLPAFRAVPARRAPGLRAGGGTTGTCTGTSKLNTS